jgi:clan AA aspartic protease
MIRGAFNADREAVVRIIVLDVEGREHVVPAVMDTGFDGYLTLSTGTIQSLGLPYFGKARAQLADGSHSIVRKYEAAIVWDGTERDVIVVEADTTPLLGIAVLQGHHVRLNVVDGGEITIRPLSNANE